MSRRPASITVRDIRRIMKAAKAEGVAVDVEIRGGNGEPVIIHINPTTGGDKPLKTESTETDKPLSSAVEYVL